MQKTTALAALLFTITEANMEQSWTLTEVITGAETSPTLTKLYFHYQRSNHQHNVDKIDRTLYSSRQKKKFTLCQEQSLEYIPHYVG